MATLEERVAILEGLLDQRVSDLEARIASVDSRVKAEEAFVVAQDAKAIALGLTGRVENLEAGKAKP